jgi:8-oxo-dGTP pyrophosphatase MutT (NUDIX family)
MLYRSLVFPRGKPWDLVVSAGFKPVVGRRKSSRVSSILTVSRGNSSSSVSKLPIPSWYFVLVVVRKEQQFLVVRERKHGQLWYLPAGRVELGESFAEAAVRETREEAGIIPVLDGIIAIQHTPTAAESRVRVIFSAHPADDRPPKSVPDEESLEARWVTRSALTALPLRSTEVVYWFDRASSHPIHPLNLLGDELVEL